MQKFLTLMAAFVLALNSYADGGMWFLQLMEQQHLADSLNKAGLKMSVRQLYNPAGPSLRDCVGQFGGGCTGEIISPNGLVLTNNHCGYSYVHAMSTLEANYLKDGYFAHSMQEELPVPELTFTFVLDVQEVTDSVLAAARAAGADEYVMQSGRFLTALADQMLAASPRAGEPGVSADIIPYYGGNRFYMITWRQYDDVRLVVNPPLNVAQFGGDGDNWVWPRHNPDFAIFRVYADSLGRPAAYARTNVPLHRDRYLPVSLKGYDEGDYAMVMGFPGRTYRYLSASQLDMQMRCVYTPVVLAGEPLLEWNRDQMALNDSIRLAMQSEHMGIQNAVKNYGGAIAAVKKAGLVEQHRAIDEQLTAYGRRIGNEDYANVVGKIDSLSAILADPAFDITLYRMTIGKNPYADKLDMGLAGLYLNALRTADSLAIDSLGAQLLADYDTSYVNMEQEASRLDVLVPVWQKNCKEEAFRALPVPDVRAFGTRSVFRDKQALADFLAQPDTLTLLNDPLYAYGRAVASQLPALAAPLVSPETNALKSRLVRTYQAALHDMNGWKNAPDANFTQRLTYGHVKPYSPRNAVQYDYKTTLEGMFEKEDPTNPDYEVNERMRELFRKKDFGRYANKQGLMQTDFLTDNDITGGNSGSPVLNAKGELIGVAFDGNIESLSSDFQYNPALQRCINADIRYVLWVTDIFGGSKYVIDELDIR